jgi:hypothetical protein
MGAAEVAGRVQEEEQMMRRGCVEGSLVEL